MAGKQPGWYAQGTSKRYWDGEAWHDAVPVKPGPAAAKGSSGRVILAVIGGLLLVTVIMSVAGGRDDDEKRSAATSPSSARPTKDGCGSVGPTCDAVPKVDGIYRVAGDGAFSTGIMSGWIETAGPRPGSDHCTWARLSGPELTIANTIATEKNVGAGIVKVLIEPTDVAFSSYGCLPWRKS